MKVKHVSVVLLWQYRTRPLLVSEKLHEPVFLWDGMIRVQHFYIFK